MSKNWDSVEYAILKQNVFIQTIPVSQLRPGDIIKIPDEYSDKGTNGKIISKEYLHSEIYEFTVLLANNSTIKFEKTIIPDHEEPNMIIIL